MPALTPFLSAETLRARIAELGLEIARRHPGGPLVLVGVLKGSLPFLVDLARAIPDVDVRIELIGVKSYAGTASTGEVRITHDLASPLAGQHVWVVEDIVDTGLTLRFLLELLSARQPASLHTIALLDKPSRRRVDLVPDLCGFSIPDAFVVGFGLDLDERYRQLDHVAIYEPDGPQ